MPRLLDLCFSNGVGIWRLMLFKAEGWAAHSCSLCPRVLVSTICGLGRVRRPGPAVTEDRGIEERGHPGEEKRGDHNSPVHSRPATTRSLCGGSEEWSTTASILGRGGRKCLSREGGLMVGLIWISPTVDWNCHFNNRWTLCENWMENECAA